MIKELRKCQKAINELLTDENTSADFNKECEKLLVKIKFFQHERLIHLIVTMTMSLLTVIVAISLLTVGDAVLVPLMLLFVMLLALTGAYLSHYFKLENGVQRLYGSYHKLREKAENVQKI
jgi:hypothetical protein